MLRAWGHGKSCDVTGRMDWLVCTDRMDPQFIRERAEKLQEYLDHMLRKSTIIERRPVMEFLELNQHPEALQDTRAASKRASLAFVH